MSRRPGRGPSHKWGCLPNGSVPLGRYIEVIKKIKRELGLTVVVHTGLVSKDVATKLAKAGIDAALIDVLGSDDTIREVYKLNATAQDYRRALTSLVEAGVPVVPHVVVGLHYGKLKGEGKALELIAKSNPKAVVIVAFMPIQGTLWRLSSLHPMDIARVLAMARVVMPDVLLALGCARPRGSNKVKTDCLAISIGVNAIAFPSEEAINLASKLEYRWSFSNKCCSQVFEDLT